MTRPRIAILGAGSWGSVLAHLNVVAGKDVSLWCRDATLADEINDRHENQRYLPEIVLDGRLRATTDLDQAVDTAEVIVLAVPSAAIRSLAKRFAHLLARGQIVVCAAKGFERETGKRMTEVLTEEFESASLAGVAALSGPNLAKEIVQGQPATSVVASVSSSVARHAADVLQCPTLRLYTNSDVLGVEYGGALKNVVAIGAGIVDGLGFGDNAKAALITRGLAEITRLGVAAGASPLTFAGLSGLGDLIATCSSETSRNHFVGRQLAAGRSWPEISASMRSVAEGVPTTVAARSLAQHYGVRMPIAEQTYAVLFEDQDITEAIRDLLNREPGGELDEIDALSELRSPADS